jgi:hypothetical protein
VQAIPLRQRGPTEPARWLLHTVVVGSFVPLIFLLSLIDPASLASPALVRSLQGGLPLPGASVGLLEWLPARTPTRTATPRDPSPPLFPFLSRPSVTTPPAIQLAPAPPQVLSPYNWVLTHREAGLFAGPGDDQQRFTLLPQWSYLKVLESVPGWLRVRYEGDGTRQAGEAWIPAGAVGPIGTPRWLTNPRETPLYAGPERDAPSYTRLPPWSVLEVLGKDEADRSLVRFAGDGDTRQPGEAWVRRGDLDVARAPSGSELPWGVQPGSGADGARLAVPYRTQLDGSRSAGANCGPTSVGMVLESFGIVVPTSNLRGEADWLQGNWDPDNGVSIQVLRTMVQRHDLRGLDLERPDGGTRRWTLEQVRHHLRAGHSVIPQVRYRFLPGREWYPIGYDHYIVLTGFAGDTFYYNDPIPSGGHGQGLTISAAALLRAWQSSSEPLAGFAVTR